VVTPVGWLGNGVIIRGDVAEDGFLAVNSPLSGPLVVRALSGFSFDISRRLDAVEGG